jgi:rfaE bifunctional protein kinase chain/domain
MASKVVSLEQLPRSTIDCLAYGHFDLIHPGHVRYLLNARSKFGRLTVAVMADKHSGTISPFNHQQAERASAVAELSCVDRVVLLPSENFSQAVDYLKPSVLVLGEEFKQTKHVDVTKAIRLQRSSGRRIVFDSGGNESAGSLLSRSESDIEEELFAKFHKVLSRNNIDLDYLGSLVKSWRGAKVLVVGDSIIDRYVTCEALGLSAEAPVVVVREKQEKCFAGGAAIVAAHVSALGGKCSLVSVVGEDESKYVLLDALDEYGVQATLVTDKSRPTTLKTRFVVESQKLFRTSRLEEREIDTETELALIREIETKARDVEVIIVSDFNYGVITERVLSALEKLADGHQCHLVGDLQCSSQFGSVLKFKNFSLITPNEKEARIALHDKSTGLESIAQRLLLESGAKSLVLKLGSEGFVLYNSQVRGDFSREAFPSLSVAPLDVTGAGDSMLAVFALALAKKQPMVCASVLASCVAAEAVETLGNTPISLAKLLQRLSLYESKFHQQESAGTQEL